MKAFVLRGRDFQVVGRMKKEGGRDRNGEMRKARKLK